MTQRTDEPLAGGYHNVLQAELTGARAEIAAIRAEKDRLRDRVHDAIGKCYSLSQPDRDALYAALEDP